MSQDTALTLSQLSRRITDSLATPLLQNVWVVAETSDVRVSGGHCYLELVEKDPETGTQRARVRATIWRVTYMRIMQAFTSSTGQQFCSDIKVMVLVSVAYHPVFGLSLNITGINPAYTMGDLMQRRMQMIERLKAEGIIDMNRSMKWPMVAQRIAVISAKGAAGYGDFINQLFNNASHIRFNARLFPAVMQGEKAPASIIAALDAVAADIEAYDCVVIIRGGGATTDLLSFDNYDLAANIAQFPLPVIIGIGHERDITLLDWVANMRVKTPTAAAAFLVQRGEALLGYLHSTASNVLQNITDRLGGCHRHLAMVQGQLPAATSNAVMRAQKHLLGAKASLAQVCDRRLLPLIARLDALKPVLANAADVAVKRAATHLDNSATLLEALKPEATLRRGYSITRINGKAIKSADSIADGDCVTTQLAQGSIISIVKQ